MAGFSTINAGSDALDLEGYAAATLALSTTAAQTPVLTEGVYDVWCSTGDCFLKVAPTANDVTAANGYLLRAANTVTVRVRGGSRIGAIVASGTPTLSYHKVA